MTERQAQIRFERQLMQIIPNYYTDRKITSNTIFFYINMALMEYIKELYKVYQSNQEMSDKLRTITTTHVYQSSDFTVHNNKYSTDYPEDYVYALGEQVYINIKNDKCPNLVTKTSDVIEATIETVDKRLADSLSEYHLRHNQAKPVRVYTDNKIVLYTDGNYGIGKYSLTYLRYPKKLGEHLTEEYTDLPEFVLAEIVDVAVQAYLRHVTATSSSNKKED